MKELEGLEELLEAEGEEDKQDGALRSLVREEQHSCHGEIHAIQVGHPHGNTSGHLKVIIVLFHFRGLSCKL